MTSFHRTLSEAAVTFQTKLLSASLLLFQNIGAKLATLIKNYRKL